MTTFLKPGAEASQPLKAYTLRFPSLFRVSSIRFSSIMMSRQAIETFKELVRHMAMKAGRPDFLDGFRTLKGVKTDHFLKESVDDRFRHIYSSHSWISAEDQQSLSGLGSDLSSTTNIRQFLPLLIEYLNISNLIDLGCGDWTWMRSINLPCKYLGIDIVEEVIESNQMFSSDDIRFECMNAIIGPIPYAEVILCREILFHLSLEDSLCLLRNVKQSSKYLFATTNDLWFNSDIRSGDFRNINLCRKPYCFPPPLISISDTSVSPGRSMGVWLSSSLSL